MTAAGETADVVGELLDRVAAAAREDLRELLRQFDLARDAVILRLLEAPNTRLLSIEEAAELVKMPVRRIRSLARGEAWALRIGGAIRIDEDAFLRWARDRARSQRVENGTDPVKKAPSDGYSAHKTADSGRRRRLRSVGG